MKELVKNKQAYFDYNILEKFEAGISLLGLEVKSVKLGRMGLGGSYAQVRGNEVLLIGAHIPPYQAMNTPKNYDENRTRRLLLTKKEIKTLTGKIKESGLTLVPLRAYINGRSPARGHGLIKIELGLGKHKKSKDKRELIKKRDIDRDIRQALKN
jgi:SsrA-binding protein